MQFLSPGILWALLAISIPILIHLFYFRRFKKVYFSNTNFLRLIKEETKNRSRLRNILVLLCRILAYTFLVFAFAQPFIPSGEKVNTDRKLVSLYVDNSFSMESRGENVALLDEARRKAANIINAYSEADRFQILSADFEGSQQRLVGKEDALQLIDEIEINPNTRTIGEIITRQSAVLEETRPEQRWRYIISDFQSNMQGPVNIDSSEHLQFLPLRAVAENNLAVDSLWFEEPLLLPQQNALLLIKITNYGNESREDVRITLDYNGQQRPIGTRDIPASTSIVDSISFLPEGSGWQNARVTVEDYPVYFDDTYYFSFEVQDKIRVLSIGDKKGASYLRAAYSGSPLAVFEHQDIGNVRYNDFPLYNLIILHSSDQITSGLISQLSNYILSGGNLLVFPAANSSLDLYNDMLTRFGAAPLDAWVEEEQTASYINTDEYVFKDVFENVSRNMTLPKVKAYYTTSGRSVGRGETLMRLRNGNPLVSKWVRGEGRIYFSYTPLESKYNDMISRGEVFIPLLYRTSLASSDERPLAYRIGQDNLIPVPYNGQGEDPVFNMEGPINFIPGKVQRGTQVLVDPAGIVNEAGHYQILNRDSLMRWTSFNYSRSESPMEFMAREELQTSFPDARIIRVGEDAELISTIRSVTEGKKLWVYCIIFALLFLLIEQLLLRFFK